MGKIGVCVWKSVFLGSDDKRQSGGGRGFIIFLGVPAPSLGRGERIWPTVPPSQPQRSPFVPAQTLPPTDDQFSFISFFSISAALFESRHNVPGCRGNECRRRRHCIRVRGGEGGNGDVCNLGLGGTDWTGPYSTLPSTTALKLLSVTLSVWFNRAVATAGSSRNVSQKPVLLASGRDGFFFGFESFVKTGSKIDTLGSHFAQAAHRTGGSWKRLLWHPKKTDKSQFPFPLNGNPVRRNGKRIDSSKQIDCSESSSKERIKKKR